MTDLSHVYQQDLQVDPTGDLALAFGAQAGQQRVIRRLLTGPGDYHWHRGYGAGLGAFVGQPVRQGQIAGVVRAQMAKETAVSQSPRPKVTIAQADTTVTVSVQYVDAQTGADVQFAQRIT